MSAEEKNPRLIVCKPLRSEARGSVRKIPTTAVSTPMAGTTSGKISDTM